MNKKLITILVVITILLLCFGITSNALEVSSTPKDTAYENTSEAPTVFTRVWEFCQENRTELLGTVGDALIILLSIFISKKSSKKTATLAGTLNLVKNDTGVNLANLNQVIGVVNGMIDSHNHLQAEYAAFKKSYQQYGLTEDDRNRVVGAVVAQNTAILEILTLVMANNKNLPQGVKDLVNLKYANCLKSLESDTQLLAIVTAVRENIGHTVTTHEQDEGETVEIHTEA